MRLCLLRAFGPPLQALDMLSVPKSLGITCQKSHAAVFKETHTERETNAKRKHTAMPERPEDIPRERPPDEDRKV